ncbi:Chitin deacetylase [Colletotrichum higginsianum IMI 349063]|uniref:Chitin deacetylase n=1 Tax=Colletotrichum higginsianum (strain IMI 349063) TaxID=759273 RepID=A0A1B7XZH4_COLHI|nr:Chitin deacetylase [Colletotrichum higginsianum IMI 349063]OBR05152.1 Chitin deacetylase [Colletotrichum higginsianum IMI 349063]
MTALEFLVLALAGTVAGSPSLFLRGVSPDNTCGTTGNGGNPSAYTCPADLPCCSVNGWCGSTGDYCLTSNGCQAGFGTCEQDGNPPTGSSDDGNSGTGLCGPDNGNVSCATNECCSAAGYCGTTPDHCKAPDCLFQFGPACDANKIPPGLNTSSIVRTKLGQVEYGGPGVYSCVNPGDVALTYDDGPASYTNDLLDLLKKYNAKATFMITGNNNAKGEIDDAAFPWVSTIKYAIFVALPLPSWLILDDRRMYADGHQIASHTWSHADLVCLAAVFAIHNSDPPPSAKLHRLSAEMRCTSWKWPPYSSCTAECGCEDDMKALGYSIIYFDLDTADYLHDSPTEIQQSKDIVDQSISAKPATTDNFLVIGHDIHQQTVYNLTEYMLQKFQGKKMVTVGECLGDPRANWYRADARTTLG